MALQSVTLAPGFVVSRIAKGNWQLAARHGAPYAREAAIDDMRRFVEAGITLFDCADHYVGVEELIGEFRRRHPDHARCVRISTKLVPDLESLPRLRRRDVDQIVETSLARLGVERLDLVQLHWWDYAAPAWLETAHWLNELRSALRNLHTQAVTDPLTRLLNRRYLSEFLPREASTVNPVDMIASAGPEEFRRAVDILFGAAEIDALLVLTINVGLADVAEVRGSICSAARAARSKHGSEKPVLTCIMDHENAAPLVAPSA